MTDIFSPLIPAEFSVADICIARPEKDEVLPEILIIENSNIPGDLTR